MHSCLRFVRLVKNEISDLGGGRVHKRFGVGYNRGSVHIARVLSDKYL